MSGIWYVHISLSNCAERAQIIRAMTPNEQDYMCVVWICIDQLIVLFDLFDVMSFIVGYAYD